MSIAERRNELIFNIIKAAQEEQALYTSLEVLKELRLCQKECLAEIEENSENLRNALIEFDDFSVEHVILVE